MADGRYPPEPCGYGEAGYGKAGYGKAGIPGIPGIPRNPVGLYPLG